MQRQQPVQAEEAGQAKLTERLGEWFTAQFLSQRK